MHGAVVELDLLPQVFVDELADAGRPVGKVDQRRLAAALPQALGEELALRGLARAVDALKDTKVPRGFMAATADMVKKRLKIVVAARSEGARVKLWLLRV